MITYTEQIITLRLTGDDAIRINAMVADNGLAYHLTLHHEQDTWLAYFGPEYTVTHIASGSSLCKEAERFVSIAECERFIELIGPLADWRQSREVCKAGEIRKSTILEAIRKATEVFQEEVNA